MEINISVVIVTWNNEQDIEECLNAILNQDFKKYNVIVVDNNSSDNTVNLIKEKFPNVILLDQKKNLYLTGGNNLGIRYAIKNFNPEFIMVLNPDTKVETNLLMELYKAINVDETIGAVGPKVKFYGNPNSGLINSAGLFFDGFNQSYDLGFMEKDGGQFNKEKYVFGVTGACILYRTKMLNEIGLYWEKIKLYLDEVEIFIRARKHGWKVLYTPKTTVWHKYMVSTSQERSERVENLKKKAWLWIALRHYPLKSKVAMVRKYIS